jgi:hypothetical protein
MAVDAQRTATEMLRIATAEASARATADEALPPKGKAAVDVRTAPGMPKGNP